MKSMFLLHTREIISFLLFQRLWKTTFDPKWINNLITFQERNLHPSKDWLNSRVFFTSDKVYSKYDLFFSNGKCLYLVNKSANFTWHFFPEDNLIRFEILKAIWGVPGKNNSDKNDTDTAFLAKLFRSSLYQKMEWTKWLQLGRG